MNSESNNSKDQESFTFEFVMECPCGDVFRADTEDELVDVSMEHLQKQHPDRAEMYEREHILFMSSRLIKP